VVVRLPTSFARTLPVLDLLFIAAIVGFTALCLAYTAAWGDA
jgi:hypothetical protein